MKPGDVVGSVGRPRVNVIRRALLRAWHALQGAHDLYPQVEFEELEVPPLTNDLSELPESVRMDYLNMIARQSYRTKRFMECACGYREELKRPQGEHAP